MASNQFSKFNSFHDYYQLGYAYFKENRFDEAIAQFNKIIGKNNALSQNAYYALAWREVN